VSTPSLDRPARHADATWLFGLFALLFALSLILHQLWWFGFEVLSPHFLVILAALWTALRPTSVGRFLTMIAAEVLSVGLDMPDVGSHTLLVLVSGACVLTYAGWRTLRNRRLPDAGTLFERLAPFLRVQLLLIYAVAAIAKLNTGFFDGAVSCAAALSGKVAWFDPTLLDGAWRIAPSIYGTVAIELALPVLLAVPRTRLVGLAVGGAFHAVLALAGNVPFSALALALYVAFLPTDTPSRLRALATERPALGRWARRGRRWAGSPVVLPAMLGCWLAATVIFASEPALGRALISNGTRLLLVLVMLFAASLLALCLARGGPGLPAQVPAARASGLRAGDPSPGRQQPQPLPRAQDRQLVHDVQQPPDREWSLEPRLHSGGRQGLPVPGPARPSHRFERPSARAAHDGRPPRRALRARALRAVASRHERHLRDGGRRRRDQRYDRSRLRVTRDADPGPGCEVPRRALTAAERVLTA